MLMSLALPIVLSAVVLFVASFLSWMVVRLHRQDWVKLPDEDAFIGAVRNLGIPRGSYSFPNAADSAEMQSEAFRQKWQAGPAGVMTVFPQIRMGRNLGLTFVYFLGVSFTIAYLAWCCARRQALGTEALLVWDDAPWHVSRTGRR